jgi:hypothetical protein
MKPFLPRTALSLAAITLVLASGYVPLHAQDTPPAPAPAPAAEPAPPAPAATDEPAKATPAEKAKATAAFNKYWKPIAGKIAMFEGKYFVAPKYDSKYLNSNHLVAAQWLKENVNKEDPMMDPPRDEGDAKAEYLPKIAPGEYGRVESFKIEKNLGGSEFIVSTIWIIDPEKFKAQLDKSNIVRSNNLGGLTNKSGYVLGMDKDSAAAYNDRVNRTQRAIRDELVKEQSGKPGVQLRLMGFPLEKPTPGERVSSAPTKQPLHVVIITEDKEPAEGITTATRYVALAASRFKTGINEGQFKSFLSAAGVSQEDFIKLAEEKASADPKEWAAAAAAELWAHYLDKNPLEGKPKAPKSMPK